MLLRLRVETISRLKPKDGETKGHLFPGDHPRHERYEHRQAHLGRLAVVHRHNQRPLPGYRGADRGLRGNYQLHNQGGHQAEAAGNLAP